MIKLFLLRSKSFNEDRDARSLGSAPSTRLQSLKFKLSKECKPNKEGSRKYFVGDDQKEKTKFHDIESPPLHPANDNTRRFDKRVIQEGTSCIAVPFALSSTKHCRLPKSSGNFFSSMQPERVRV